MSTESRLAETLPRAPEGWTRHVDPSAREVEYRLTQGQAAVAKVTVRADADGGYRLASKRGCRVVSETTADSVEAAATAVRGALDGAG
jgi:hypothetical protein